MSYNPQDREFLIEVEKGNVPGHSIINKFGFDSAVTSTLQSIADAQVYQTPTTAVSLEILSSDANDAAAGTGARTVEIQGLDANFAEQTQTVTMNGTTAAAITGTWMRVFRARVTESGTYASQSAGSHAGTLTVRVAGAGATWATIGLTTASFPMGQTEIGAYTIPAGKTAYLLASTISVDKNTDAIFQLFARPFNGAWNLKGQTGTFGTPFTYQYPVPLKFEEKTDLEIRGDSGNTCGGGAMFDLILVDNE